MDVDPAAVLAGTHPHGYLLLVGAGRDGAPSEVEGWRRDTVSLPGATLWLQPRTVATSASSHRGHLILLGHPVDVARGTHDGPTVARRLADTWATGGEQALVRETAYLGGRFTLVARTAGRTGEEAVAGRGSDPELLVVPDTMASQPVLVGRTADRAAVGSSPVLVADALRFEVDPEAEALLATLRERMAGRVSYLPGVRTAYRGVRAVLPNTMLRLRVGADGPVTGYERFWPWQPRVENPDVETVHAEFRERLTAHLRLLADLGRPAVSLTGGLDSRVSAAAAAPALRARDGFAFTYVNPREAVGSDAAVQDVLGARDVAGQLRLPHRVLRWRQPPRGGTFDVVSRRTYAPRITSRGAAHAMWADLPADLVQLQSNGAEIATTYTKAVTRPPHELDARWLTRIFAGGRPGAHDDLAEQLYGDYLEQAPLSEADLLGHDAYDLVYWEQRMGRWGWQKFCDGDFGHRVLLPFNDRRLLETMLSLPYPLRRDKVLFHRLLDDLGVREPARGPAAPQRASPARPGVAAPTPPGPTRLRRLTDLLPWRRTPRPADPAGPHDADPTPQGPGLPWGYALVARRSPSTSIPDGFLHTELPGSLGLHRHPSLPAALSGRQGRFALVLGEPCDLPDGRDGPAPVADLLHQLVVEDPSLERAATRAAALTGAWAVVLGGPDESLVLGDPVGALGPWLSTDGTTLASGAALLPDGPSPPETLGARSALLSPGSGGRRTWRPGPLPELDAYAERLGTTAPERLRRHVELLLRRGPAVLCAGPEASLLGPEPVPDSAPAVTCWDPSTQAGTLTMLHATDRAFAARRELRLLSRAAGADWSTTLDQEIDPGAVLWLGLGSSPDPDREEPGALDLVAGVRPVALPWSDRVLDLLGGPAAALADASRVRGDG